MAMLVYRRVFGNLKILQLDLPVRHHSGRSLGMLIRSQVLGMWHKMRAPYAGEKPWGLTWHKGATSRVESKRPCSIMCFFD